MQTSRSSPLRANNRDDNRGSLCHTGTVANLNFWSSRKEKGPTHGRPKASSGAAPLHFSEGLVSSICRLPFRPLQLSSPGLSGFLLGFLPAIRRRAVAAAPRFFIFTLTC